MSIGRQPPLSTGSDDDYLCLVESGKQRIKEVGRKFNRITWKLLSESAFVLRIAPPPLSRGRRIKMKKSISGIQHISTPVILLTWYS